VIVTEDDQRRTMPASAASMAALATLAQGGTVMSWDPKDHTLIVANVVGQMPWSVRDDSP
jgi:hypothetical protein